MSLFLSSVTALGVDDVHERLAGQAAHQVIGEDLGGLALPAREHAGDVLKQGRENLAKKFRVGSFFCTMCLIHKLSIPYG